MPNQPSDNTEARLKAWAAEQVRVGQALVARGERVLRILNVSSDQLEPSGERPSEETGR
jgi:hypothetical protein